jgi:hypothetical protein
LTTLTANLYKIHCDLLASTGGSSCLKCKNVIEGKHEPTSKLIRQRGKDASLIVFRDTRDVVVSTFHWAPQGIDNIHMHSLNKANKKIDKGIKNFVFHTNSTMEVIRDQNAWVSVVRSLNAQQHPFMVIFYEELLANTFQVVSQVARLLRLDNIDKEGIEKAIALSSFEAMREKEKKREMTLVMHPDSAKVLQKSSDKPPEQLFGVMTRKGQAGGYADELDEETIKHIENMMKRELDDGLAFRYVYARPHIN